MGKWLKTGTLKKSASRTEFRTDFADMEITVDQQDDNHEVKRPTDWPVQGYVYRHLGSLHPDPGEKHRFFKSGSSWTLKKQQIKVSRRK
ncbi:hypothetical protein AVEN_199534-1 [Araneus ventricosus]|uniref:Uncharacterized protein n=1 Tax=Araneus ventricosus TaxID=182803 RepID=A0A4Y2SWU3_ARAVE|nr:hypothetical protein AVEN_122200-1 [Araneus ventricosus]GBN92431.1 hypothetical protein AVEN_199534-1 [Araneus ventricosus]